MISEVDLCVKEDDHTALESVGGCSSPSPRLESIDGEPLMSETHGQCDDRLMVTVPTTRLVPNLYCLMTEAHAYKQLAQG